MRTERESGGRGYRGRETSAESQRKGDLAESQELMEAGESEEGRPQRRLMNGWRLEIRRKGDLSGESEEGRPRGESGIDGGWGVGGRPQRRVMNGWRLESQRKGDLSGESEERRPRGESGIDGGWGVGGRETSASHEWVEAGELEEGRPQRRVRNGWSRRNGDLSGESGMGGGWVVGGRETSAERQEWVEDG
ncbi:hypothetical protein NDU88_001192 [Pleurodeles waltl]|uniref:Uncharacterized protein n=1 Tax=Pleurodeles waltl TaxID=8319 RepID=A0AAV7L030_PLEWA|nr:hypothetical protein NDU88_001192 [Pleurodeles waltl]